MKCSAWLLGLFGLLAIASLPTTSAHAQNRRSWVSGDGSNANPCTRAAPCFSIGAAVLKTISGGEVNCLNSYGEFGGGTIDRAITIDCGGVLHGIDAPSTTDSIIIQAAATDKVILRNLNLHGNGSGQVGIYSQGGGKP